LDGWLRQLHVAAAAAVVVAATHPPVNASTSFDDCVCIRKSLCCIACDIDRPSGCARGWKLDYAKSFGGYAD
jgi:hypothetical protein